jgi:hypothetical protein
MKTACPLVIPLDRPACQMTGKTCRPGKSCESRRQDWQIATGDLERRSSRFAATLPMVSSDDHPDRLDSHELPAW